MTELQTLRELIGPRGNADRAMPGRDAVERARAQIAEAQAYKHELGLIRAAVERTRAEMTGLGDDAERSEQIARAYRELDAIVGGTERATQSILRAAEDIGQSANKLSASVMCDHEQGLTHDIQNRVVQIFEAYNFQDLTGQRVAYVLATLKFVEQRVARLQAIWHGIEQFTRLRSATTAKATSASSTARNCRTTAAIRARTSSTECSAAVELRGRLAARPGPPDRGEADERDDGKDSREHQRQRIRGPLRHEGHDQRRR